MGKMVEIKLGEYRSVYKFELNNVECQRGDSVILESERGSDWGNVVSSSEKECKSRVETAKGKVLRLATEGDLKQIENNRVKAKDAKMTCVRKVVDRRLSMQVIKSEYTFDSSKIIFSFTAEGRIDFRSLVKDLAKIFRVRIELKQIGVRDKAKIVSGYGICGRELCCASYMKHFHPLTIKMAKEQGLPLNPSRISGVCGRIKCCMAYEFSVYKEVARSLPKVGEKYETEDGKGRVIDLNILKRMVTLDMGEGKIVRQEVRSPEKKEPVAVQQA